MFFDVHRSTVMNDEQGCKVYAYIVYKHIHISICTYTAYTYKVHVQYLQTYQVLTHLVQRGHTILYSDNVSG